MFPDLLNSCKDYNELFKQIDLDNDGIISYQEFLTAAFDHQVMVSD